MVLLKSLQQGLRIRGGFHQDHIVMFPEHPPQILTAVFTHRRYHQVLIPGHQGYFHGVSHSAEGSDAGHYLHLHARFLYVGKGIHKCTVNRRISQRNKGAGTVPI